MSLDISTHGDVMKLLFNITRFELQYTRFIEDASRIIIDEEILQPIKNKMKSFGYSEKIIEGTQIDNLIITTDGFLQFDVISEYNTKDGFDVATAREEGTKDHFIKPKVKLALSWIVGGFVKAFSKGHWIKGFTKSNIIKKTIETKFETAQKRLDEATIRFFNETVSA